MATKKINTDLQLEGKLLDGNGSAGTSGQILSSTGTATDWISLSEISGVDGTGTANTVAMWSDTDTITDAPITINGNSATFAGNIFVGSGSSDNYVKSYYSDGTYTGMYGYGLYMSRTSSYIRPTSDNTHALYIGTDGQQWATIAIDSSTTAFKTNGSEHMRITSGGNVGIGTTNPIGKLHINTGTAGITQNIASQPSGTITFSNNSGGTAVPSITGKSSNNVGLILRAATPDSPAASIDMLFDVRETDNTDFATLTSTAYRFARYGNSLLEIKRNGNVGIGTTSPQQKLHIDGGGVRVENSGTGLGGFISVGNKTEVAGNYSAYFFGNTNLDTTYFKGGIAYETLASTNGRGDMHFLQNSAANGNNATLADSVMTILNGGNVGIGTTNPGRKLTVTGDTSGDANNLLLANENDTDGDSVSIGFSMLSNNTYVKSGIFFKRTTTQGRGDLIFANNNEVNGNNVTLSDAKITIQPGGNVGIGTTDPSRKLDISANANDGIRLAANNALIGGGAAGGDTQLLFWNGSVAFYGRSALGGSVTQHQFRTSGTTRMVIDSSGNVGIGTTSPSQKLHVSGNARVTGFYYDSNNSPGTPGQVLSATSGGTDWIDADTGSAQNIFKNVAVSGQPTVVADSNNDTLTFGANKNISITTNANSDTVYFYPKVLETCNFVVAFKSPSAQTNYLTWVNGSYQASLDALTYKTALYDGEIDVVKIISDVTVSGVYIDVYETGAPTTPIWSSGSTSLTANTVTSFSPSGATFSANDQLYVTLSIPTSATVSYRIDFGLLYD